MLYALLMSKNMYFLTFLDTFVVKFLAKKNVVCNLHKSCFHNVKIEHCGARIGLAFYATLHFSRDRYFMQYLHTMVTQGTKSQKKVFL